MEWLKKITDFIMPVEPMEEEYEEENVVVKKQEPVVSLNERKVANGGSVTDDGSVSYNGMRFTASHAAAPMASATAAASSSYTTSQHTAKPQFTVHNGKTAQSGNMMIRLCTPRNFDQVTSVADDIKGKRAVLINYDKVDLEEQRRICDFVNGVCYVTNGDARRISNNIVLYVPDGVDAEEAMTVAMTR